MAAGPCIKAFRKGPPYINFQIQVSFAKYGSTQKKERNYKAQTTLNQFEAKSALWSLGVVEQLGHVGLGVAYYLHHTLVLVVLSGALVLGMYHLLIQRFKIEYFRRVMAVGYSCVVFGWMTILSVKQPSSKLDLFGFLSLPISFAPFESLIFTSIIVPQASFLGHLSGIVVGYAIAWGLIHGMNNYWAISMLGWIVLVFVVSLKQSGAYDFDFLEIESVTDPSLPSVRFLGSGRTLQMSSLAVEGVEIV
ncbi:hypothetical protein NC651_018880 [Populus alba x Populus x berolinensis]|nr:hypothetical protein NC651_018880 [Populus alba x Populus x berolinensis]